MNVTDATIERYLAGELSEEATASLESEIASAPALKARVDALKAEREAFFAADPPAAFAHRLMTRLDVAKEQSVKVPWWRTALVPVFATTAVLLIGVGILLNTQAPMSPDTANIAAQQVPSPPPPVTAATPPIVARIEAEAADKKEAPAAVISERAKADTPSEPTPSRERAAAGKKAQKAEERDSVMDPNDNRVSDELSRKDADDSLRGAGSGLGIGSASTQGREYAKAPPAPDAAPQKEEAPRDVLIAKTQVVEAKKSKDAGPEKSAAPTAAPSAKPASARGDGGAYGYAEITVESGAKGASAEQQSGPVIMVPSSRGVARAPLSGQTLRVLAGRTVRVAGDWPAAYVALVSIDSGGKLSALYQGSGKAISATLAVSGPMTIALLRSAQPLQLDLLSAKAAKLQEKAMSLTFIPSGIEKRFVRLLVED